jgi:hypothetical protein
MKASMTYQHQKVLIIWGIRWSKITITHVVKLISFRQFSINSSRLFLCTHEAGEDTGICLLKTAPISDESSNQIQMVDSHISKPKISKISNHDGCFASQEKNT